MQEAGASAEISRGCMPRMRDKMQLPRGPTFLQQFYSIRTISIVRIRRAIILVEVDRNFGLLIKTILREKFSSS